MARGHGGETMLFGKTCRHCGHRNPAGARFCAACGDALQAPRRRAGCAGRSLTTLLLLTIGVAAVFYLARSGGGLLWGRSAPGAEPASGAATATPAEPGAASAAGLRAITYLVSAEAAASGLAGASGPAGAEPALTVTIDYVATGGVPAQVEATLPWQQAVELAPGCMARIVAQGAAGRAFTVRIQLADRPACEARAAPALEDAGLWRAQCEAACGP